ncbi:resistin-like [Chrysemys picta bellii]|uniref:resistin-like n=1 Tax=Chrysemys picta bellii TaxID=8478 RepID=UPI0032B2B91A
MEDFATSAPAVSYLKGQLVNWGTASCKIVPEGSSAPGVMKAAVFLLLTLLVPAYHTDAQCVIDNVVDLKVQAAVNSIVSSTLAKAKLLCQNVSARGALVSCPAGESTFPNAPQAQGGRGPLGTDPTPSGMRCGSWDIRSDSICHCQCRGIDWTSARCCKIGL